MTDLPPGHEDHPAMAARNSRYGLMLFAVYLVLYGGFMFLTVFDAQAMSAPALFGVNLAIVSGIGLIVAALLLSGLYGWLCRPRPEEPGE